MLRLHSRASIYFRPRRGVRSEEACRKLQIATIRLQRNPKAKMMSPSGFFVSLDQNLTSVEAAAPALNEKDFFKCSTR
jgi:hypothetical protein